MGDWEMAVVHSRLSVHCLMWWMTKLRAFWVALLSKLVLEVEMKDNALGNVEEADGFFLQCWQGEETWNIPACDGDNIFLEDDRWSHTAAGLHQIELNLQNDTAQKKILAFFACATHGYI